MGNTENRTRSNTTRQVGNFMDDLAEKLCDGVELGSLEFCKDLSLKGIQTIAIE